MKITIYLFISLFFLSCDENKQSSQENVSKIETEMIVLDSVLNSTGTMARIDTMDGMKVIHNEVSTMCYVNDSLQWIGFKFDYLNIFPHKGHIIYIDSGYVVIPYENGNIWYEGEFVKCCKQPFRFLGKGVHIIRYSDGKLRAKVDFSKRTIIENTKTGGVKKYNFEEYKKIEPHMVQWIEID